MPDTNRAAWQRRLPPLPLALLTLALLQAQGAWAQTSDTIGEPLVLRRSPMLQDAIPPNERGLRPSLVEGDRISGRPDLETRVEGKASLRRGDTVIHADTIEYDHPQDQATATGNVRVNQAGNVYEGPELKLKVETFEGYFNTVRYSLLANGAHGDAKRVDFIDADRAIARSATYTTCRREDLPGWMPAWFLSATNLHTDTAENVGRAENAKLTFMGISTPPIPSVSFPLNNERKTGLLPPTIGMDSVNGVELVLPFYWNIAPNRDATITPTVMSKRGVNLSTEFRFLEKNYSGEVRLDYMPQDKLRERNRWGLWGKYQQQFQGKPLGLDSLNLSLNASRVSDDDYWRDFTRTPSLVTRLLPIDGSLNWTKGDWDGQVRAVSYQTLQYSALPILPPYDRLPQITANYTKYDWRGFDFSLNTDYTRFQANPIEQGQPNGERAFARASLSRPFMTPGAYITPKVQLYTASYQTHSPMIDGRNSASITVPTFSVDSGMTFERDTTLFGRAFRQTLEPRAFYTYTPYRDQSRLPVYDTAANDFSFATVFTENEFSGNDRISATNALTLGLTSRLLDPASGNELARFGIAQRRRFSDQNVTIPDRTGQVITYDGSNLLTQNVGMPGTRRALAGTSDLILGAQLNLSPKWSLGTTVLYNPQDRTANRGVVTATYSPGPYRSISASYRYQADRIAATGVGYESFDVGWQWPLNDLWGDKGKDLGPNRGQGGGRWYSVGRVNYDIRNKLVTDAILGFEYDGCCYIGRVVLQQLSTGQATSTKRIMFQLEFVGFASLGSSPMQSLRQNIPHYQPLRGPTLAPSRFTNYD